MAKAFHKSINIIWTEPPLPGLNVLHNMRAVISTSVSNFLQWVECWKIPRIHGCLMFDRIRLMKIMIVYEWYPSKMNRQPTVQIALNLQGHSFQLCLSWLTWKCLYRSVGIVLWVLRDSRVMSVLSRTEGTFLWPHNCGFDLLVGGSSARKRLEHLRHRGIRPRSSRKQK